MNEIWKDYKELMARTPQHLLTGVSYMIPTVVAGGLIFSFAVILSGATGKVPETGFLSWWIKIGSSGLTMFIPLIGAYVAFSMVDRPGIAPGIIAGYIAQQMGGGFLVAVLAGLLAGSVVFFLLRLIKVPGVFMVLKGIIIVPVVSAFIVGVFAIAVSYPVSGAMAWLGTVLTDLKEVRVVMGVLIGAMNCFDMGGPVGKVAYSTGVAFVGQGIYYPMGMGDVTFPVPPMAMALAVFLARNKYHKGEVGAAMSAFILHFVAISEGAIPFALADPLRVIPGLMVGGAVGGGLAGLLGIESKIPWGSYVGIAATNNPIGYLICMYGGSIVGALVVNALKKPIPADVLATEEQEEVVQLFA